MTTDFIGDEKAIAPKNDRSQKNISTDDSTATRVKIEPKSAVAQLRAVGFQPGNTVWVRLWLPKDTPIELARERRLAYQDREGAWQLSVINGYLSLKENGEATFTQLFGSNEKTYEDGWQQLANWNCQGFGVGFIPNRGGKRNAEITECGCLFYEVDDRTLDEQFASLRALESELGCEATFVLQTRKSLHCWFRLSALIEPNIWSVYQQRLAQYQKSDTSLKDPSQLMRLAGFLHQSISPSFLQHWEEFKAGNLSERKEDLAEAGGEKDVWSSVPVAIVQDTGTVFELEDFDRVLPKLETKQKARTGKKSERSSTVPDSNPIPIQLCLSPSNRKALKEGVKEGRRNHAGFALACDLLGVASFLDQHEQASQGDPYSLFLNYCDRCKPPLVEPERESIWQSAESESREPARSTTNLKKIIQKHMKNSGSQSKSFSEDEDSDNSTIAELLMAIADQATYFRSLDRKAYADVPVNDTCHTYAVNSSRFKQWLTHEFYKQYKKTAGSEAFSQVLKQLEAQAIFEGETKEVFLRVAEHEGKIYLDLGTDDWTAIEIDCEGWQVVSDYPVRFRRPDLLLPLPVPEDGDLAELRELLNLDDAAWVLTISWLLFCLYPSHPHPILILHGEQGTGKSFTAKVLKQLVDPGKAPLVPGISDLRNLAISANSRWILAYDNLSELSNDQSDALCRISTGGGFSTRTLYSNDEETVFEFMRPQILTGIDSLVTRGDLLERSLLVELPTISEDARITEAELEAKLSKLTPRILGALLTALSETLKALPETNPKRLPRMADFTKFSIAAETALGLEPGSFMAAYEINRRAIHETALDSCPVASAIQQFMQYQSHWQGTATDLLKHLEALTDEKILKSRAWVRNYQSLGKLLDRLKPDLRGMGIKITKDRRNDARLICIERTVEMSQMSPPSQHGSEMISEVTFPSLQTSSLN